MVGKARARGHPSRIDAVDFLLGGLWNAASLVGLHIVYAADDGQAKAQCQQDDANPYQADDRLLIRLHNDPVLFLKVYPFHIEADLTGVNVHAGEIKA